MFKEGKTVKAVAVDGIYNLTSGKTYQVVEYIPPYQDPSSGPGFIWPAYVTVRGDDNTLVTCHLHRFSSIGES